MFFKSPCSTVTVKVWNNNIHYHHPAHPDFHHARDFDWLKFSIFRLVDKFQKFHKIISELAYFTMNSWTFHDDNTTSLINRLSKQDKVLFEFDAAKIDWNSYMKKYMIGIRTYIIKDPIETLPEGLKHRQK